MFLNVKVMVFLFGFLMFVCVCFFNTIRWGFQPIWATVFCLGAKSRVNGWSTVGSKTGPRFGSNFWRHMWTSH